MKKLSNQAVIGQLGANLVERIVLEMGQVWRQTVIHDTGVDGEIEMRDPQTQEVFNRKVQVQCKATGRSWESESSSGFFFRVSKDDLEYWLRGNVPTILVLARPSTNEAYWISISSRFSDPESRGDRRIEFSKKANRFDKNALPALWDATLPATKGLYRPPIRREEELISNLLPVREVTQTVYLADTEYRTGVELRDWLKARKHYGDREWVLRERRILSVHDLREPPWNEVCDRGTVEEFDSSEWHESTDADRLRTWVQLLNRCLAERLFRDHVRLKHDGTSLVQYFAKEPNRDNRSYSYRSLSNRTEREVVQRMKTSKISERYCYRHSAMTRQFHRFRSSWYLEIAPTYLYTKDGRDIYEYHSDQLAGIKRLEKNEAVLGQVIMWERLLTDRGDLLRKDYEYLKFDELMRYEVDQGIPDDLWLPTTADEISGAGDDESEEFLF